jgi:hypothetical protein
MVKAITYILANNASVQTLVGRNKANDKYKVYPVVCPSAEENKYLVVSKTSNIPVECKQGRPTSFDSSFDVFAYCKNYDDLDELTEAVKSALDRIASNTYNGVNLSEVRYANEKDLFSNDNQLYVRQISFNCWIDED